MLEDAYNEIMSLVQKNNKIHFISFDKFGKVSVATSDLLKIPDFETIQEALEYIETL